MKASLSPAQFGELLLSHHPNCTCFRSDVVIIGGRRVCAGCLAAYPTALFVLFFLHPAGVPAAFAAVALALLSQARRFARNPALAFFYRIVAGVGLGFGIGAFLWAYNAGEWLVLVLLVAGALAYAAARAASIFSKLQRHSCRV